MKTTVVGSTATVHDDDDGHVVEVILYDHVLSNDEHRQINRHLSQKYNIPVPVRIPIAKRFRGSGTMPRPLNPNISKMLQRGDKILVVLNDLDGTIIGTGRARHARPPQSRLSSHSRSAHPCDRDALSPSSRSHVGAWLGHTGGADARS